MDKSVENNMKKTQVKLKNMKNGYQKSNAKEIPKFGYHKFLFLVGPNHCYTPQKK